MKFVLVSLSQAVFSGFERGVLWQLRRQPDFSLFTWFFVIPGILLVGIALTGLLGGRDRKPTAVATTEPVTDEDREPALV